MAKDDSGTWSDHNKMKTCTDCKGEGERTSLVADANGKTVPVKGRCNTCQGTGEVKDTS